MLNFGLILACPQAVTMLIKTRNCCRYDLKSETLMFIYLRRKKISDTLLNNPGIANAGITKIIGSKYLMHL